MSLFFRILQFEFSREKIGPLLHINATRPLWYQKYNSKPM